MAGYLIYPLLAGAFLTSGCAHVRTCDDAWYGRDKRLHFVASAALGAGITWVAIDDHGNAEAAALGLGIATFAGAGKEAYDLTVKKTCWSWRDFAWDILGASVGASAALWVKP